MEEGGGGWRGRGSDIIILQSPIPLLSGQKTAICGGCGQQRGGIGGDAVNGGAVLGDCSLPIVESIVRQ